MTKISSLTALTGAGVDTAADLLAIVDMSLAGAARNKKITIDEFALALQAFIDARVAAGATGLLDFKGSTDCAANPNYPAASKGDFYVVSVAGKIGGASGIDVEVGDAYFAEADNAGGTQAAVGTDWSIVQGNTTGAGAGVDVEDEGVSETVGATTLNFVGAGVTAADAGGGQVDITIPGGGGGIDIEDEGVAESTGATILNFVGALITAADQGGGQTDVTVVGDLGVLHVQDQKAATTDGGTFTSGAWRTRVLNTVVLNTIASASLASNQISLPAGTYDIDASAPGFRVAHHQTKLVNITDTADVLLGTSDFADTGADGDQTRSFVRGRFTLAGTKTLELQHQCNTTLASTGLGSGAGNTWGTVVYANVVIKRIS